MGDTFGELAAPLLRWFKKHDLRLDGLVFLTGSRAARSKMRSQLRLETRGDGEVQFDERLWTTTICGVPFRVDHSVGGEDRDRLRRCAMALSDLLASTLQDVHGERRRGFYYCWEWDALNLIHEIMQGDEGVSINAWVAQWVRPETRVYPRSGDGGVAISIREG